MKHYLFILLFLFYFLINSSGQIPDSPEDFYVSIIPETGFTVFSWIQTDTSDVDGYFIGYLNFYGGFDTLKIVLGAKENQWTRPSTNGRFPPEIYAISAINFIDPEHSSFRRSAWSDSCSPVWISDICLDECTNSVNITWTPYKGWNENLESYTIYRNYEPYDTVAMDVTSFIDTGVTSDSTYTYYIEANNINGHKSTSYARSILIRISDPPEYINAIGTVFTGDKQVEITFTVDPNTELDDYYLIRSKDVSGFYDTIEIKIQPNGGSFTFQDEIEAEIPYYYQLLSMNSCGLIAKRSSISSTIQLTAVNAGSNNMLSWNSYMEWTNGIGKYELHRLVDGGSIELLNPGPGPNDTLYTDNVEDMILNSGAREFCYYLTATEGEGNPYGTGFSQSNTTCVLAESNIYIANTFTPNGDGINDEFKPLLTFPPKDYLFIIRNRIGNTLFKTDDPEVSWKGDSKGKPVPEGTYIYFLQVEDQEGMVQKKTGQVMVLYPGN